MCKCKYCGEEFESKTKLGGHTTYCKLNPNRNKNLKKLIISRSNIDYNNLKGNKFICQYCGKEVGNKGCLVLHEKSCLNNSNYIKKDLSIKPKEKIKRVLSAEHKEKIRRSYHKWMDEHYDDFIKYSSGQSNVCEHFKEVLRNNNIDFIEEYCPYWKERGYRLDIAFPDEKIGIEINGTQHYKLNGELNESTLEKQIFFENHGWTIIQLYYKDTYGNNPKCLNDILKLPIRDKHYIKNDFDIRLQLKQQKEKQLEEKRNNKLVLLEEENNKRKEIIRNLIENSNIDFSKRGWSSKAKDFLKERNELFSNHIFQNIVKYFPDFLKHENVFKRKGSIY